MRTFLKLVLGGVAVLLLFIAVGLGFLLLRWPTVSQIRNALGKTLIGHQEIAVRLCRAPDAAGIVGLSFEHDIKPNDPASVPLAEIELKSPEKAEKQGHGLARVSGLARSAGYIGGNDSLLPNAPRCSGTVSFDYRFFWNDNGVSRKWDCEITNVSVVDSNHP